MANLEEITEKNFKEAVLESSIPVIVDFWAPWCGPCRKLTPVLEQIQNEFKDTAKFYKIDSDKNMNVAKEYGIAALPTVLLFKEGKVKEVMAGMFPKSTIISNIKKYL